MKKKVIFVTHLYYPARGGVEHHIKDLSEGLVKRGYVVKVLTTNAYSTEAFFLDDKRRIYRSAEVINGVAVERLPFRTFGKGLLNRLTRLASRFRYPFNDWVRFYSFGPRNKRYIEKIIEFGPDIIFAAPLPTLNTLYAYKAAKHLNAPLIVIPSVHILDPHSFDNRIFFRIMREADTVMAQSLEEKEYLIRKGHIDGASIVVFPPLPLKQKDLNHKRAGRRKRRKFKARRGIAEDKVVLCLGQHGVHKNIHHVLGAMGHVWRTQHGVALVIAGGTTGFTPVLKAMAADLERRVKGKTYFFDNFSVVEKDHFYDMADIFISLSEFESFGIVFAEALSRGVPVIASKRCVIREIVTEFKNAMLVDPYSTPEVTGVILELLTDDDVRKKYSKGARKLAKAAFEPKRIIDQWENIFERVAVR